MAAPYLTLKETMDHLRVGRTSVHKLVKDGKLKRVFVLGKLLFDRKSVESVPQLTPPEGESARRNRVTRFKRPRRQATQQRRPVASGFHSFR